MEHTLLKKIIIIVFGIALVIGIIFYLHQQSYFLARPDPTPKNVIVDSGTTTPYLSIHNTILKLEIADTPQERQQGLSNRASLPQDTGLLFVFEDAAQYGFWMKDMDFPIDMIWLDENFKVVYIKENADPELYPEIYKNEKPALYVLETNADFVRNYSIKAGDVLNFTLTK